MTVFPVQKFFNHMTCLKLMTHKLTQFMYKDKQLAWVSN